MHSSQFEVHSGRSDGSLELVRSSYSNGILISFASSVTEVVNVHMEMAHEGFARETKASGEVSYHGHCKAYLGP